ncbi:protein FAM177A1-like isoform X1 [Halichoeres trimaculatus]|uniref:protein FAM177A1-like isoform X1 n=1 Tax=Halichoeres trimaculatus TaxID=147232 RepID=UPI003D9F8EB9
MADISLYLTNVNVSIGQTMDVEQSPGKDFESVELGDLNKKGGEQQKEKVPRRIIHFSSGETMEEYSTDEEEGEEREQERKDLLSSPVDASKLTWGPYFWFHMWRAATSTISACDYLGERMASLFGITSAKYQYAIDEYYRMKKEREEEKEETRLSEEAEQSFDHLQPRGDEDEPITVTERSEVANPDVTYQIENENQAPSSTITVPAIVTAT